MKIKKSLFALPVLGLLVGALVQPAEAQTYYSRTVTSYDAPGLVDRTVEDPVMLDDTLPMTYDRPVTIERPVVIDRSSTIDDRPLVIKEHPHHAFHMGLFPLGDLDVF